MCHFFFFQAEDGIRDVAVTGVQTCALPISSRETGGASTLSGCASNSAAGKTLRKAPKPRCVPSQPNTFPRPRAPAPRGVLRRGVRTRQPTRAAIPASFPRVDSFPRCSFFRGLPRQSKQAPPARERYAQSLDGGNERRKTSESGKRCCSPSERFSPLSRRATASKTRL